MGQLAYQCSGCVGEDGNTECVAQVLGNRLVPWRIDVGPARMTFDRVEFSDGCSQDVVNLTDFRFRGVTFTGDLISDFVHEEGNHSCAVRANDFCAPFKRGRKAQAPKYGIRMCMNTKHGPGESKVDVVDIDLFRCPPELKRLLPEDRLMDAIRPQLTDHFRKTIDEQIATQSFQTVTIDEDVDR